MAKPLEEWTLEELKSTSARILDELARRAAQPPKASQRPDVVKACEHWIRGHAWDETFTQDMVEDEFGVHERKLGQQLPPSERRRLLELWSELHRERAQRAA